KSAWPSACHGGPVSPCGGPAGSWRLASVCSSCCSWLTLFPAGVQIPLIPAQQGKVGLTGGRGVFHASTDNAVIVGHVAGQASAVVRNPLLLLADYFRPEGLAPQVSGFGY